MTATPRPLTIGVLALQGAYDAHAKTLTALGAIPRLVRTPAELDGLDGLIMPGGESTTMLKFLEHNGFFDVLNRKRLREKARSRHHPALRENCLYRGIGNNQNVRCRV